MSERTELTMTRRSFLGSAAAAAVLSGCRSGPADGFAADGLRALMLRLGNNFGNPQTADRSLRFDAAVYRATAERMAAKGVNALVLDLGEGVVYPRHPEIAVGGAWSADKVRQEVRRLRDLGIVALPKLDFSADHRAWLGKYSMLTGTPECDQVLKDLIADVVELFEGPAYVHLGWDDENERNQRDYPLVFARRGEVWWRAFEQAADAVRRCGARPWIWAGRAVFGKAEFRTRCPKDVVLSYRYLSEGFAPEDERRDDRRLRSVPDPAGRALCVYRELDDAGFDQIPCGARLDGLAGYCRARLTPARLLGLLAEPGVPTIECNRSALLETVGRLSDIK